ncbi:hypothetical protein AX16_000393 [Volvariella volvacea WC 439]|nr:hypothetical protein AX16_000393 [Volvariella volvacea WC 439]
MRGVGRHSGLVDISTVRILMGIGGWVPLPSDALVTPVTFKVKRRHLRGILAEYDAAETGERELSGEWVVGKKTWQNLQTEWKASRNAQAGLQSKLKKKEQVIFYIHGGAYYLSSAAAQRLLTIPLSKYTDTRVFAIDYRLAPETHFPGPLHDVVAGYLRLVEDLRIPSENVIVTGDSAGGGLSLALLMYLRDNGYPLPAAAVLMSPWVDLTMSCESWDSNANYDVVPFPSADSHMNPIALYLGDHMERYLTHPYASPLFGDCTGLPPLLIQAGDAEVLRDEITLFAHKAKLAGVEVRHELYEDAIHVFQTYPFFPATQRAFLSMHNFVRALGQQYTRPPQDLDSTARKELAQEFVTNKTTVVDGDGVEAFTPMDDDVTIKSSSNTEDSEDEPTLCSTPDSQEQEEFPSWHPASTWSSSIATLSDGISSDITSDLEDSKEQPSALAENSSTTRALRRIQSAISVLIPSQQPQTASSPIPQDITYSGKSLSSSPALSRISALTMTQISSPPPSPSLRRNNASHPDLTSLVNSWSQCPANETLLYKNRTATSS